MSEETIIYAFGESEDGRFHEAGSDEQAAALEAASYYGTPEGDCVYVGRRQEVKASDFVGLGMIDSLLRQLRESAFDEYGEVAEGWLCESWYSARGKLDDGEEPPEGAEIVGRTYNGRRTYRVPSRAREHADELVECLSGLLDWWTDEHGYQPSFWTVTHVQAWRVTSIGMDDDGREQATVAKVEGDNEHE